MGTRNRQSVEREESQLHAHSSHVQTYEDYHSLFEFVFVLLFFFFFSFLFF